MKRGIVATLTALVAALVLAASGSPYSSPASVNDVASWLALRPVTVRCLTPYETSIDPYIQVWGALAYVHGTYDRKGRWRPFNYTVFEYGICEPLTAIQRGDRVTVRAAARSILVLTHEAGHLRGHRWASDEARTQCWAMRHFRYTAQRLGITNPDDLRQLMSHALALHAGLPGQYHIKCQLPTPYKGG